MRKLLLILISVFIIITGVVLVLRAYFIMQVPVSLNTSNQLSYNQSTNILGVNISPNLPNINNWWAGNESSEVKNLVTFKNGTNLNITNLQTAESIIGLPINAQIVWYKNSQLGLFLNQKSDFIQELWGWNGKQIYLITQLNLPSKILSVNFSKEQNKIYLLNQNASSFEIVFIDPQGNTEKVAELVKQYSLISSNQNSLFLYDLLNCYQLDLITKSTAQIPCITISGFKSIDYKVDFARNLARLNSIDLKTNTTTSLYEGPIEEDLNLVTNAENWIFTTSGKWQSNFGLITPASFIPKWLIYFNNSLYISNGSNLQVYDFGLESWVNKSFTECLFECKWDLLNL